MQQHNYQTSILVDATAHDAFNAINDVTGWWTRNVEGNFKKLNDEFIVRFGDVHMSKQKLVEVISDKKVVWLVTESRINFVEDKEEWTNTRIMFEIAEKDDKTEITFTHIGLVPTIECYKSCSNVWNQYIHESLFKLLMEGKGTPA